jgi:IS30 family transposase
VLRRKRVAELLSQGYSETEIARDLGTSISSVSRDVGALREQSHQFINNLAKGELAFEYKKCFDALDAIRRELWSYYNSHRDTVKLFEMLAIMKLIKDCEQTKFSMM